MSYRFSKLNDDELPVMFDYSHEWKAEEGVDCECDDTCFPKSRLACDICQELVRDKQHQLHIEEMEQHERNMERHDHREGYLDDGQMFYNHHEANDSWYD
jgi:hypothetical protein